MGFRRWFFGTFRADSVETESISTEDLDIGSADFVQSGDFVSIGPSHNAYKRQQDFTATDWSDQSSFHYMRVIWDDVIPSNANGAILTSCNIFVGTDETVDVRLRNKDDGEDVWSVTGLTSGTFISRIDTFTPTTTGDPIQMSLQWQTNPGNNGGTIYDLTTDIGVQL